jgi:hypothetical protein
MQICGMEAKSEVNFHCTLHKRSKRLRNPGETPSSHNAHVCVLMLLAPALALSAVEWVGEVISDSRQVDGRAYGPAFFCPKVVFFVAIN